MQAQTDAHMHTGAHAPTRMRAHTPHTHTTVVSLFDGSVPANRDGRFAGDNSWSLAIEINTGTGGPVSPRF